MSKKPKVVSITDHQPESRGQVLARLCRDHESALQSFFRARLISPEDREDMVQEVFFRLARMESLAEFEHMRKSPLAYLHAIANNLVVDYYRKKSTRQAYELQKGDGSTNDVASPETLVSARQELARVRRIILNLSPRCRQAFVLNRFQHMSYRQVAEEMGISLSRVEKYMIRALLALRKGVKRP